MLLLLALIVGSVNGAWAETKSVDVTPDDALNKGGVDPITISCEKGDGTSNPAISSGQLRLYQAGSGKTTGNTITFSSAKTITKIEFTFANNMTASNGSFSDGSYDSETSTWTGSTTSLTLTVTGKTSGKRIYITEMTVYYEDDGTPSTPSIDANDVNIAYNTTSGSISYTVENPVDGGVLTASTKSDWLTCGAVTATKVAFNTETNAGDEERNATVTLTYTYNNDQTVTKDVTVTQGFLSHEVWVETALDKLTSDDVFVIVGNNGETFALSNDNGTSSGPSAVDVTVADGKLSGTIADNIKWNISGNSTDGYTFYPNGSTTTWLYCTNTNNGVRVGTNEDKTFEIDNDYLHHKGTERYVGIYNSQDWRCYTSINSNITGQSFAFYKQVTKESVTVTADGLATYVSDYDLDYTGKSISAYIAKEEGGKIKMTQVYKVPAGTGVLLRADGGATVDIPVTTEATNNVTGNLFKRGNGEAVADGTNPYNYILNNISDKVGFYRANNQIVAKNRAYLQTSINAPADGRLSISFDDEAGEATGISEVKDVKAADAIFNLNGVRVKNMTKGLYIVNGKKVIVK